MHIHGAGGRDVMEGSHEALSTVARTVARHGTTSMVATTVTASADDICRSCEGIAKYIATQHEANGPRAKVLGIHFEGPFLSEIRRGVHPAEWLRLPIAELLERFVTAAGGKCADADDCAGTAGRHSVYRCGASKPAWSWASAIPMRRTSRRALAMAHGAHHAVHVYNAMRPFSHRDSGVIGAVLTTPDVTAELIADGVHVEEAAMRAAAAGQECQAA